MNHYAGSLPPFPSNVDSELYHGISTCHNADTLFLRFLQGNDGDSISILRHLVEKYRKAAGLGLSEPGTLVLFKVRLAVALLFLFEYTSTVEYVEESISLHRQTLLARAQTGLDPSPSFCGIAAGVVTQAMVASDSSVLRGCLEEAIRILRRVLSNQRSEGSNLEALKSALSMHLLRWVKLLEGDSELEEADKASLDAMNIPVSDAYSDSVRRLARASFLRVRYEALGNHTDLQDAITLLRNIVQSFSYTHSPPEAGVLRVLCICLQFRAEALGYKADLDESITISRLLFARCPSSHINRTRIVETLTSSLGMRYDSTENLDDLDEVILLQREVYQAGADPNSGVVNLGMALRYRYMATGRLSDLDDSLDIFQQAKAAKPVNIIDRVEILRELGYGYFMRFEETENDLDLQRAIDHLTESYYLHPPGSKSLRFRADILPRDVLRIYHKYMSHPGLNFPGIRFSMCTVYATNPLHILSRFPVHPWCGICIRSNTVCLGFAVHSERFVGDVQHFWSDLLSRCLMRNLILLARCSIFRNRLIICVILSRSQKEITSVFSPLGIATHASDYESAQKLLLRLRRIHCLEVVRRDIYQALKTQIVYLRNGRPIATGWKSCQLIDSGTVVVEQGNPTAIECRCMLNDCTTLHLGSMSTQNACRYQRTMTPVTMAGNSLLVRCLEVKKSACIKPFLDSEHRPSYPQGTFQIPTMI
jgi:tetratricopeptide (TPR) repeat protein